MFYGYNVCKFGESALCGACLFVHMPGGVMGSAQGVTMDVCN